MSIKGVILIILGLVLIGYAVWVLATGASMAWVPYGFAVLWAITGVVAIDYFSKHGR